MRTKIVRTKTIIIQERIKNDYLIIFVVNKQKMGIEKVPFFVGIIKTLSWGLNIIIILNMQLWMFGISFYPVRSLVVFL